MLGHELTPVGCSRHVVRRRQRIGRRTSFWSMGLPVCTKRNIFCMQFAFLSVEEHSLSPAAPQVRPLLKLLLLRRLRHLSTRAFGVRPIRPRAYLLPLYPPIHWAKWCLILEKSPLTRTSVDSTASKATLVSSVTVYKNFAPHRRSCCFSSAAR